MVTLSWKIEQNSLDYIFSKENWFFLCIDVFQFICMKALLRNNLITFLSGQSLCTQRIYFIKDI